MSTEICFLNKHNTSTDSFKLHLHECHEAIYFLNGNGCIIMGDKKHRVSQNSFCIIPPEIPHTECIEGYGEIMFIGFNYDDFPAPPDGVCTAHDTKVYSLFCDIFDEYKNQSINFRLASAALMNLLVIESLRASHGKSSTGIKSLEHIKEYLREHSERKINIRELASLCGYSNDHFRHIFKKRFGVSPQEYMIDIRLSNAAKKLCETELSCTEIAYLCGFSNSAQFSSMFAKKFGIPPNTFRNADKYKNNNDL